MNTQSRPAGCSLACRGEPRALAASVQAHHSFAMFDSEDHEGLHRCRHPHEPGRESPADLLCADERRAQERRTRRGRPADRLGVEMDGSAQWRREGVSVNAFPPGTVFSVGLHPLRNGQPAGSREGGMFKCPDKTPPAPGMHCDSVKGHIAIGKEPLPKPDGMSGDGSPYCVRRPVPCRTRDRMDLIPGSAPHWHLVLNHLPSVGTLVAVCLLAASAAPSGAGT